MLRELARYFGLAHARGAGEEKQPMGFCGLRGRSAQCGSPKRAPRSPCPGEHHGLEIAVEILEPRRGRSCDTDAGGIRAIFAMISSISVFAHDLLLAWNLGQDLFCAAPGLVVTVDRLWSRRLPIVMCALRARPPAGERVCPVLHAVVR